MRHDGFIRGFSAAAAAALLLLAGCGGEETTNNYYQTPQLVQIRTASIPPAVVGQAYSVTLAASGGSGAYSWSIETGGVNDSWLSIDATTGELSGTPTTDASFVVIIRCADADEATNFDLALFQQYSHTVLIKTARVPDAVVGSAFAFTLEATGGSGSYGWSIEAGGENDSWLAIGAATGWLSGTPALANTVTVVVRVEDSGNADFDEAVFVFDVEHAAFPGSPVADNNHDGDCFKSGVYGPLINQYPAVLTASNHANGTAICLMRASELMPGAAQGQLLSFATLPSWAVDEPVINLTAANSIGRMRGYNAGQVEITVEMGTFSMGDQVRGMYSPTPYTITGTATGPNWFQNEKFSIWASYFDGTGFTPWVEIQGAYITAYIIQLTAFYSARVIFLNTEAMTPEDGGNRDGDAIITFATYEVDDVVDVRLFSTYFDATHAATPVLASNPDVKYGFNTQAVRVNTDSDDANVEATAFMTDGLFIQSPSFDDSICYFLSGNPVTWACAVWTERSRSTGGGTMYTADFDLSDTNAANTFSAPDQVATATSMDANDRFYDRMVVCGSTIFYRVMLEGGTYNHRIIEAANWNTATRSLEHNKALSRSDANDAVNGEIDAFAAFGSIQGLSRAYAVGYESGYDEGGCNADRDVMLYIFDPSDGSSQTAEIDGLGTNTNARGVDVLTAEMNRTGEVIFVGWLRGYDNANSSQCFFMQAVQTGGSGRSIANSTLSAAVLMNSDYASAGGYADVVAYSCTGDVNYLIGSTSDHLRANAIFVQEPDTAQANNLSLRCSYLKVALSASDTVAPTYTGGFAADTWIWSNHTNHPFWDSIRMENFACVDSGTAGKPVVYFVGDGDSDPLTEPGGGPFESRLFVWDGRETTPAAVEISGDCADCGISTFGYDNSRQVMAFSVQAVPITLYAGAGTEESPPTHHHVVILEERNMPGSWAALRHRCLDLGSTAPAIQDRFFPPLTLQPFDVSADIPDGVEMNLGNNGGPPNVHGTTLGLYWRQGPHLYYNEYAPGSSATWILENGEAAPAVVDGEVPGPVRWWNQFFISPFTTADLDLLGTSAVFFSKDDGAKKLYVRVHD